MRRHPLPADLHPEDANVLLPDGAGQAKPGGVPIAQRRGQRYTCRIRRYLLGPLPPFEFAEPGYWVYLKSIVGKDQPGANG